MTAELVTISQPIVGIAIKESESEQELVKIKMNEKLKRPQVLRGYTYKVTTPVYNHSIYITINDMLLNEGTEHESWHPFEVFINSKNMDSFQWIVALTRIMSAVFRKGGDVTFIIEELKSVFDPKGGYYKIGGKGKFMNSLVAEIGDIVEQHLVMLGLATSKKVPVVAKETVSSTPTDKSIVGKQCPECLENTFIPKENCTYCTSCGYSTCG